MRSLGSPVCYHNVCKLEVHIICFMPPFLSTQMKKFFGGCAELLVDIILSAEPQQSSHHCLWLVHHTLSQCKNTNYKRQSESKNLSLGSRWNLQETECIGDVFKATLQSAKIMFVELRLPGCEKVLVLSLAWKGSVLQCSRNKLSPR